jgi:phage-related protein
MTPAREERAPARETAPPPRRAGPSPAAAATRTAAAPIRLVPPATQPVVPGSAGRPLPAEVARAIEQGLGVDASAVRVHDDAVANEAARKRGVRAFAFGTDVYLGRSERATDLQLMAHEVAHIVQQTGRPALQLFTSSPVADPLEREAQTAGAAVARGESTTVTGRTAPREQGGLLSWARDRLDDLENWVEDKFWDLADEVLPSTLVRILRYGIFKWLKDKIADAARFLFETLMRPVNAVVNFIRDVVAHFKQLVDWMAGAVKKLMKGDCSSIAEAADTIVSVVKGIGMPIVDKVKEIVGAIGDFFKGIWKNYLSKAWEWLKDLGGAIWDAIKWLGEKLWELTKPIRDLAARAWNWLKSKIFGDEGGGAEGENGLIAWVKGKAEAAWDWAKEKLEPIKKPLIVIGVVVLALSPAGPVIAIGAAVGGLIKGAQWIGQKLRDRNSVIRERGYLQGVIIPGIMGAVNAVWAAITKAASFLTGLFGAAVSGLGSAVGGLAGSIFSFLAGLVGRILGVFKQLAAWAAEMVGVLAGWIKSGFDRLRGFLQPLLDVIIAVGAVIADVFNIVKLIFTKAWHLIPACIRDPIVNFIRDQILKRIPIFSQLLEIPDIWTKVKETAFTIIRQIFRDGDLAGAALTFFKAVLSILSIPIELVTGIFTKAASALGTIIRSPIRFLRSVLGAMWQGFKQFFGKILKYLLEGVLDWLTGQLKDAAIEVPSDWSFAGIVKLLLSVLGVTLQKIWTMLGDKIGKPVVEKLKKAVGFLTGAWEWVSALITEGPAGLWKKLKEEVGQLKEMMVGAIAGYLSETLIVQASVKILTALNPVGAIVNAIILAYKAIQTAAQYARQILEIVSRVLDVASDLAAGAIGGAANVIETLLGKGLTIAIGFLANYLNLGGFGRKVAEMVKKIQDAVEKAIGRIIDWAINAGRSILNSLGFGGKQEDAVADSPEKAAMKQKALADVRSKSKNLKSDEELKAVLVQVHSKYKPEGLKSLSAHVDSEDSLAFTVKAAASPEEPITLRWEDVFTAEEVDDETVSDLEQIFMRQGFETYAAVAVDGALGGFATNAAKHAESELLASGAWDGAILQAHQIATKEKREVRVFLLINRAPCHSLCTPVLVKEISRRKGDQASGTLSPRVKFILAPTGVYEPTNQKQRRAIALQIAQELAKKKKIALKKVLKATYRDANLPEPAFDPNVTQMGDLVALEAAGWDLRQLQARETPTVSGQILASAIAKVKQRVAQHFNDVEKTG